MARTRVHGPPYGAARSLLEWAVDLWPYVNGKGIVNGLQLASMRPNDMLDVLHYFFEDDLDYSTAEQAKVRGNVRTHIYEGMYESKYKYLPDDESSQTASGDYSATQDFDSEEEDDLIDPFASSKEKKVVKPFMKATTMGPDEDNPFDNILDAPLG